MERLNEHLDVLAILRGAIDPANWFHQEALARVIDLVACGDLMTDFLKESATVPAPMQTVFTDALTAIDGERIP